MRSRSSTRRQFMGATTAGAALFAPQIVRAAPQQPNGRKGKTYPDQRKKHTDSQSGRTVWQLTDTHTDPNRLTETIYFTNRHVTRDSRWIVYLSDRANAPGRLDLFKMDLRTGESLQLTESGNVVKDTPDIGYDAKEVFYIERDKAFQAVNLETLEDRKICVVEEMSGSLEHALSLTPDNRVAVIARALEPAKNLGYEYPETRPVIRSALITISTDNGQRRRVIDGNAPLGHVAFSPTDGNLILYSIHVNWSQVQRPWLIRADGTGGRAIFIQHQGEGAGHEFWSASGRTIFLTCHGGRQPQGLWAVNLDGSNERCVLAGSNIGHGAANTEEDRYVVDELYTDSSSLWISKKGSPKPEVLCKMAEPWFAANAQGKFNATRHHPHPRFLPNSTGVTFSSGGEIFQVEL